MDMGLEMQHGKSLEMQHGRRHAARTWMQHMGMNMQYGHEHAACPNHFIEVEVKS
jgi:hypothetical protein